MGIFKNDHFLESEKTHSLILSVKNGITFAILSMDWFVYLHVSCIISLKLSKWGKYTLHGIVGIWILVNIYVYLYIIYYCINLGSIKPTIFGGYSRNSNCPTKWNRLAWKSSGWQKKVLHDLQSLKQTYCWWKKSYTKWKRTMWDTTRRCRCKPFCNDPQSCCIVQSIHHAPTKIFEIISQWPLEKQFV